MQNNANAALTGEPNQANSQLRPRPTWLLASSLALTVVYALIALGSHYVIPAFSEVFKSFDAALPSLTQFLVKWQGYYFLIALIPLAFSVDLWFRNVMRRRDEKVAIGFLIGLGILLPIFLFLLVVGLYLPIFRLGSVV